MTKTVPAVKARQQLGSLLNEVDLKGTSIVIERDGKAKAVMIPVAQFEAMEAARERFFDSAEARAERVAEMLEAEGRTQEDLESDIAEAVREVRKERRAQEA